MNKSLLILIILLIASVVEADELSENAKSDEAFDVSNWMTYYYQNPTPELTFEALRACHADSALTRPQGLAPLIAFMATIFRDNPVIMSQVFDSCTYMTSKEVWVIGSIIWMAGTDASKLQIESLVKKDSSFQMLLDNVSPSLLEMDDILPAQFDMFWASFFASGDTRYVQKVVDVLSHEPSDTIPEEMVYIATAYWSLKSNCIQHPIVHEYCKGVVNDLPELGKSELQKILTEVDQLSKP